MKTPPALSNLRHDILDLPHALRETLTKGRPEFEALIRRTRWGEGPLYIVGSGASEITGRAGARAFETYLGRPVIARQAIDFRAYSLSTLQPRSVLLAISEDGQGDEILETSHAARRRGAAVLVVTATPESELAKTADGLFLIRCGPEERPGSKTTVCQQAVLGYLSLLSAHILARPEAQTEDALREFESLPELAQWVLSQLRDAVSSLAAESRSARRLYVTGAGFYYEAARQGSYLLRDLASTRLDVIDPFRFGRPPWIIPDRDGAVVLLSGSRCRLKRKVHEVAELCRKAGLRTISITDGNERELVEVSRLAVLLPVASEMLGALLSLIVLASAAVEGMICG
jgi:fructoselysine-6-P-deglycase FrlB-like protein